MENIARVCVSLFFHVFPPRKACFTNGSKSNPPNAQVSTPTWPMRDILNLTGGLCQGDDCRSGVCDDISMVNCPFLGQISGKDFMAYQQLIVTWWTKVNSSEPFLVKSSRKITKRSYRMRGRKRVLLVFHRCGGKNPRARKFRWYLNQKYPEIWLGQLGLSSHERNPCFLREIKHNKTHSQMTQKNQKWIL